MTLYSIINFSFYLQITLQSLQGLQAGPGGSHILLKTENGQFQLIRVAPPPSANQSGTLTPNSIAGQTVVATPGAAGQTYRLATLPAVSRLNAQYTGPTLATIKRPIQVTHVNTYYETRSSFFVEVLLVFFIY